MPTQRPRYTVTDTGRVSDMLDLARRTWPDVADRKQLLLRLATEGHEAVKRRLDEEDAAHLRSAQRKALSRAESLVHADVLLGDAAWR